MSQAALDAYLDIGEGLPACPACGGNSYVGSAFDRDTGAPGLLCCHFCRDPDIFFVDDDGSVVTQSPECPCCGGLYTQVIPKQEPAVADESTLYSCEDCPAVFWLEDGEYVSR